MIIYPSKQDQKVENQKQTVEKLNAKVCINGILGIITLKISQKLSSWI